MFLTLLTLRAEYQKKFQKFFCHRLNIKGLVSASSVRIYRLKFSFKRHKMNHKTVILQKNPDYNYRDEPVYFKSNQIIFFFVHNFEEHL